MSGQIYIARPCRDLPFADLQYLLAENGKPIGFPDKNEAADWLLKNGYADADELQTELDGGALRFVKGE